MLTSFSFVHFIFILSDRKDFVNLKSVLQFGNVSIKTLNNLCAYFHRHLYASRNRIPHKKLQKQNKKCFWSISSRISQHDISCCCIMIETFLSFKLVLGGVERSSSSSRLYNNNINKFNKKTKGPWVFGHNNYWCKRLTSHFDNSYYQFKIKIYIWIGSNRNTRVKNGCNQILNTRKRITRQTACQNVIELNQ